ncbi:helix-turn-helix transcriptional regulator [Lachnoclostridium sp. Marseille-P6806]|uniref:helix-turn-helix transcriptional regulator n=1 Tax=Lachnoclostridium sp. Marseille-P6806 TaxID=2364793 RepID=UPI001031CEDF|nr:AraC family transcriptional regulator [Lachnoclostridium sp. Marseille-P6806]
MKSSSDRILETPSPYARAHYYHVQEIGTLQSLEPHVSRRQNLRSFLFFIVLSGRGRVSIGQTAHAIAAGDCVWIDCSGEYSHESSADDPWSLFWIHYNGPDAAAAYANFLEQGRSPIFHPGNLLPFTDTLDRLFRLHKEKPAMMELLSHKYITDIVTACCVETQDGASGDTTVSEKLRAVHAYLEEHYAERLDLDRLAGRFYLSKYYLSREFRKHYGTPLFRELSAIRLSHAKSLLRFSDRSVSAIAADCGFQEAGYFIRVFREAEGMTPLEYRRRW